MIDPNPFDTGHPLNQIRHAYDGLLTARAQARQLKKHKALAEDCEHFLRASDELLLLLGVMRAKSETFPKDV